VSVVGLAPSPHVLAPSWPGASEDVQGRGFAALQGVNPTEPGNHSEDWFQPPWSLQPHPISEHPPQLRANPRLPPEAHRASTATLSG